ncbi:hypothetical protein BSNK01_30210 [Bacillaceae bacterium]
MSTLHIRQIKHYLEENIFPFIKLTEEEMQRIPDEVNNMKYTRALVAMALLMESGETSLKELCKYITDGFHDNGLDGVYYNRDEKCLYLVQAKYCENAHYHGQNREIFFKFQRQAFLTLSKTIC